MTPCAANVYPTLKQSSIESNVLYVFVSNSAMQHSFTASFGAAKAVIATCEFTNFGGNLNTGSSTTHETLYKRGFFQNRLFVHQSETVNAPISYFQWGEAIGINTFAYSYMSSFNQIV